MENNIEDAEGGDAIGTILSRLDNVVEANLLRIYLGLNGCISFLAHMHQLPHLRCIDISGCSIGDDGVQALAETINDNMGQLNIGFNEITSRGLGSVTAIIQRCTQMEKLDISGNPDIFNDLAAVEAFADALPVNAALHEISTFATLTSMVRSRLCCFLA